MLDYPETISLDLGKIKNDGKPRPIIIKFLSYRQRKKVFDAKRKLKGQKIMISEDLTKKRYKLLQQCLNEFEKKNVWCYDGRIYCITNQGKQVFTTVDNLSDFLKGE